MEVVSAWSDALGLPVFEFHAISREAAEVMAQAMRDPEGTRRALAAKSLAVAELVAGGVDVDVDLHSRVAPEKSNGPLRGRAPHRRSDGGCEEKLVRVRGPRKDGSSPLPS